MTARQGGAAVGPLEKLVLFPTKAFHHFLTHCCKCGNATSMEKAFKVAVCKSSPETLKCLGGGGWPPAWFMQHDSLKQRFFLHRISLRHVCIEVLSQILPNWGADDGLICTHLSYSLVLWGVCANDQFLRAFKLQNEAIRILAPMISWEVLSTSIKKVTIVNSA